MFRLGKAQLLVCMILADSLYDRLHEDLLISSLNSTVLNSCTLVTLNREIVDISPHKYPVQTSRGQRSVLI